MADKITIKANEPFYGEATFVKVVASLMTVNHSVAIMINAVEDHQRQLKAVCPGLECDHDVCAATRASEAERTAKALAYYDYCCELEEDGFSFSNWSPSEFEEQEKTVTCDCGVKTTEPYDCTDCHKLICVNCVFYKHEAEFCRECIKCATCGDILTTQETAIDANFCKHCRKDG